MVISTDLIGFDNHICPMEGGNSPEPTDMPQPGRRCPSCLEKGEKNRVIPGRCCFICGTAVN